MSGGVGIQTVLDTVSCKILGMRWCCCDNVVPTVYLYDAENGDRTVIVFVCAASWFMNGGDSRSLGGD